MKNMRRRYPPSARCAEIVASSALAIRAGRKWC
jgi:hypothetical protein